MGMEHAETPSPGVATVIGFAVQVKLARFESAALQTPSLLDFTQVTRRGHKRKDFFSAEVC